MSESMGELSLAASSLASTSASTSASDSASLSSSTIPILQRVESAKSAKLAVKDACPICVIVVGMAGSGKTTFMTALQRSLDGNGAGEDEKKTKKRTGYCLNLDPATKLVPFGATIDIRDTVDYREVMKQHNLGPNGAIMTCLNLFSTKFDQVMQILETRAFGSHAKDEYDRGNDDNQKSSDNDNPKPQTKPPEKLLDYILVDTPGQIEAFTWSASGTIISSSLASAFPTVLAYVVDTPRCVASPNTFMSNMLYACSMLYRTRLPLLVVFNKIDVASADVCREWMEDYETFQEVLDEFTSDGSGAGYYASLTRSLSLVLDEFYGTLRKVGTSAATGEGLEEFWMEVDLACEEEFAVDYVEDLAKRVEEVQAKKRALGRDSFRRLKEDLE